MPEFPLLAPCRALEAGFSCTPGVRYWNALESRGMPFMERGSSEYSSFSIVPPRVASVVSSRGRGLGMPPGLLPADADFGAAGGLAGFSLAAPEDGVLAAGGGAEPGGASGGAGG